MRLLENSGLNFDLHRSHGIPQQLFAEYFIASGFILNPETNWITFHGGSDFGYFVKLLLADRLAKDENEFLVDTKLYFPNFYDTKYMLKNHLNLYGGLEKIAQQLDLQREGEMHQAGSDSYLTLKLFFKLRDIIISMPQGKSKFANCHNVVFGLGLSYNDENYIDDYLTTAYGLYQKRSMLMNDYEMNSYSLSGSGSTKASTLCMTVPQVGEFNYMVVDSDN